jgi:hypothetical protein
MRSIASVWHDGVARVVAAGGSVLRGNVRRVAHFRR